MFLPLVLAVYDCFFNRKPPPEVNPEDSDDDQWNSIWDDFMVWLKASRLLLVFSTLVISYSASLAADFMPKSSYFCSAASDSTSWVIFLQWVGMFMDAAILNLSWKVISWAKTTRTRLRTLGGILTTSSVAAGTLWLLVRTFQQRPVADYQQFRGLDSIYTFDIISSGITCGILAVSGSLWFCATSPLALTGVATFIGGVWSVWYEVLAWGTYRQPSRLLPLLDLSIMCWAFAVFTFTSNMRTVLFVRRMAVLGFLICVICVATVVTMLKGAGAVTRHPVNHFVYNTRVESDRWLRYASVSTTIKLAVSEYKERHHDRDPPTNFDKWYEFAMERNSVIIDKYDQIEKDILPFWGLKPSKIKERLEIAKALPDVGIIDIVGGKANHNQPANPADKEVLDEAVSMISAFAQYLPDMSIVINLRERPRVLVPWDDIHRLTETATRSKSRLLPHRLSGRRVAGSEPLDGSGGSPGAPLNTMSSSVPANVFRHLQALACPPGSPTRAGVMWNVRDHCSSCTDPHSHRQFLKDLEYSLDPCHQPDIFHLHDFHTLPHSFDLHQDLLPLFSRSKTDSFNDIILPLIRPNATKQEDTMMFDSKLDQVFWQEEPAQHPVTHDWLHGGHKNRLVRLTTKPAAFDKQAMFIGWRPNAKFAVNYENEMLLTQEMNRNLPIKVSYARSAECQDPSCQAVLKEDIGWKPRESALVSRYIMALDTANGPSPDTLPLLRSNSVPVISTIFREWYTERLMPWLHFVPLDVRYHGFYSTLSYFTGLKGRGTFNGRERDVDGEPADAKWIADQGRKWADKALRREDMEVYLFRLLLEWGRVLSEDRDTMTFTLKD